MVSVLGVAPRSAYRTIPGVECYDRKRDLRTFGGGTRVVCHPPCRAWSAKCAHQAKPQDGEKELGLICAHWLRECGGVLEHPANSRLFDAAGLPRPGETDGDLWTVSASQAWWGYPTDKNTWLCFAGVDPHEVKFPLRLHASGGDRRTWQLMSQAQRSRTPVDLALWLVAAASLVRRGPGKGCAASAAHPPRSNLVLRQTMSGAIV